GIGLPAGIMGIAVDLVAPQVAPAEASGPGRVAVVPDPFGNVREGEIVRGHYTPPIMSLAIFRSRTASRILASKPAGSAKSPYILTAPPFPGVPISMLSWKGEPS